MRENEIPVLILEDARKKSYIAIEAFREKDNALRLFKESSGSQFKETEDNLADLKQFLKENEGDRVRFEDTRSGSIRDMLKKLRYSDEKTDFSQRGIRIKWNPEDSNTPEGMRYFGVSEDFKPVKNEKTRIMFVYGKKKVIGAIAMSDYGRFARAKANSFLSDGYGMIAERKDPSIILKCAAKEMKSERKRYLILGPEHAPHAHSINPFYLWHMRLFGQHRFEHHCKKADSSETNVLARLTSEYEDGAIGTATALVAKNMANPAFKYILSSGGEGFALLRFMEHAEGMINDLFVSPKLQGKGFGDELTRGAITILSESCINIHLNTIYPRAKRLYEKYGFNVQYTDFCVALNQRTMSLKSSP